MGPSRCYFAVLFHSPHILHRCTRCLLHYLLTYLQLLPLDPTCILPKLRAHAKLQPSLVLTLRIVRNFEPSSEGNFPVPDSTGSGPSSCAFSTRSGLSIQGYIRTEDQFKARPNKPRRVAISTWSTCSRVRRTESLVAVSLHRHEGRSRQARFQDEASVCETCCETVSAFPNFLVFYLERSGKWDRTPSTLLLSNRPIVTLHGEKEI